jgi:Xaa-Pro dipeptidase
MTTDPAITLAAEKLARVPAILQAQDIDCWMTFVRESRDCPDPALPLIFPYTFTWRSALIVTRHGERIAVVAGHDADAVRSLGHWQRIETYRDDIRPVLSRVMRELNPASIALNYSDDDAMADGLSHGMYRQLCAMLPDLAGRFCSAAHVIRLLRGRKSQEEITRIRRAIEVTDRIFEETAAFVRIGMKEAEIADFMRGLAHTHGAETAWDPAMCPIVTSGPESMAGHGVASQALAITPGRILNIDFGIRLNDSCSDQQRA